MRNKGPYTGTQLLQARQRIKQLEREAEALAYKVLELADAEPITRERDALYAWVGKLSIGPKCIENWQERKEVSFGDTHHENDA
jgi:DNA repair ATPase RecN